jgi:hypothetical protein
MNKSLIAVSFLIMLGLLAAVPGCVGMHGTQPSLDALQNAVGEGKPVVEAFFEYPGPQERWAGPNSLVVHVVARDGADPTITTSPNVFQPEAGVIDFSAPMPAKRSGLTTSIVRERLAIVGTALNQPAGAHDEPIGGCLSPIRARIIRIDGSVTEKRGCRSQTGWAFQASDAAMDLLTMAENGPPRVPAAVKAPGKPVALGAEPAKTAGTPTTAVADKPADTKKPAETKTSPVRTPEGKALLEGKGLDTQPAKH